VRLRVDNHRFSGQASDTDIVVAAAQAYMNGINRIHRHFQAQASSSAADTAGILF
jgi:2-isopropylmalate synthase